MDEQYSTVEADWRLGEAGVRSPDRRTRIDAAAAQVILEDWLAARAGPGPGMDPGPRPASRSPRREPR
jgi:hypothetical protein